MKFNPRRKSSEFARKHGGIGKLDFLKNSQDKDTLRINKIENETIFLLGNHLGQELEKGPNITKSVNYPIIQKLEKIGLIGEDITKAKIKHIIKQKIKNPDIRIITANIEYSPLDKEEFRKQIPEMLEQKLIRRSESPHKTAAFIVRNHSEEKRGKPRIEKLNKLRITEEHSIVEDILEKFGKKFLLVGGNMASRSLTGKIYCKIFSSLPQIKNGSYITIVEDILEKFGEKFLLVGGNMASRSLTGKIYCKFFSSLPQIKNGSYIPAKKRIFFYEKVRKIKEAIRIIKPLELPLVTDYIIIECDGSKEGWGAVMLCKNDKYCPKNDERISAYSSGNFGKIGNNWMSLDFETSLIVAFLYCISIRT